MRRIALVLVASCGAEPPVVVARPPPPSPAATAAGAPIAPAPPLGARWLLDHPASFRVGRALDLGGGRRVLPSDRGERWLLEGTKRTNAPRLLDEDLVAAIPSAIGVDFVGAHGSVYRLRDPLGEPYEITRNALGLGVASANDKAIVGATPQGLVFRSTDGGKIWSAVKTPALAVEVALSRDGRGLLLMVPELLASTSDHGATWAPIAAPDVPASTVAIADDGAVYAGSPRLGVKLIGDALGKPGPTEEEPSVASKPPGVVVARALGAGTAALLAFDRKSYWSSVAAFGAARTWKPISGFADCFNTQVSAHGKTVSFACLSMIDGKSQLTEQLSVDGGATFQKLAPRPTDNYPESYAAGPNGWLLHDTEHAKLAFRSSADAPFQPIKDRLISAIVDATGKRLVALSFESSRYTLVESPIDHYEPVKRAELKFDYSGSATALSIADDGTILVAAPTASGVTFTRVATSGAVTTTEFPTRPDHFAVGGDHALIGERGTLYESYGGPARQAGPTRGAFACALEGCVTDTAWRAGWDQPARIGEPYEKPKAVVEAPAPAPTAAPVPAIACTVAKKPIATNVMTKLDPLHHVAGELRLLTEKGSVLRRHKGGKLETIALFPPQGPKQQTVLHALPGGVVAVRYSITPKTSGSAQTRPIRVTVAWLRDHETTPHTANLGEVGTFMIRNGSIVEADLRHAWIVGLFPDGIAVQPTHPRYFYVSGMKSIDREIWADRDPGALPIYVLRDTGGPAQKLAAPPLVDHVARRVFRTSTGFTIVARMPGLGGAAEVFETKDGQTWQPRPVRLWTLASSRDDETWGYPRSSDYHTGTTFELLPSTTPTWTIANSAFARSFLGTLQEGRFIVRAFGMPSSYTVACASKAGSPLPLRLPRPAYTLTGVGKYPPDVDRISLEAADDGAACVRAIGGIGAVIPLDDPQHSMFSELGSVYEMSCVLP